MHTLHSDRGVRIPKFHLDAKQHNTPTANFLSTMAFLSLANEIIIEIVEYLDNQRDINSVGRVNRRFHNLFDDYLLRYNMKFRGSSALLWAAKHGRESTARRLLHLGADVNVKLQKPLPHSEQLKPSSSDNTKPCLGVTPLHMAAWKGHLAIVKLLLQIGANPEARNPQGWTPLYAALVSGHEKISRTISRHISNLHNFLVNSEEKLTPLHVASRFGLSKSVRYFLEGGADVDAKDRRGWTPIRHALESDPYVLEMGYNSTKCRFSNYFNNLEAPSLDKVFETVTVLLEFGANPDLETTESIWDVSFTARELGACHRDKRVRALFGSVEEVFPLKPPKPDCLQIGRTWMSVPSWGISGTKSNGPEPGIHINDEQFYQNQSSFELSGLRQVEQDISSTRG